MNHRLARFCRSRVKLAFGRSLRVYSSRDLFALFLHYLELEARRPRPLWPWRESLGDKRGDKMLQWPSSQLYIHWIYERRIQFRDIYT
ncbi:hypothetical protein KC19_2G081200 [Ceratodon purpureus]|uniref:Uncharacterized protein n=1 Tax=Ceratodon purpureus TaxID=3225 RepID=A0A8T0ITI2_CERPU|nr:hypothetical protein KC19_2G081200 [Ceratodon purpureus]